MTVVIGYIANDYTLLATDTRITFDDSSFYDGVSKLRSLPPPLGWCAGLGYSSYLNKVKEQMQLEYMRNLNEIERVIIKSKEEVLRQYPESANRIMDSILCLSYNRMIEGSVSPNIGIYQWNNGSLETIFFPKFQFFLGYPSDINEIELKLIENDFDLNTKKDRSFDDVINTSLYLFQKITQKSKEVSSTCEIGIHLKNGRKYSISGYIDELISDGVQLSIK